MAEVAAAAIAVEQVVATGVEVAVAAAVASPTQPPKVTLTQLSKPQDSESPDLARSHHSVTVLGETAYIFGGEGRDGTLCSTDMVSVSLPNSKFAAPETRYQLIQAFPMKDTSTATPELLQPAARRQHAACAQGGQFVIVHGGRGAGNSDGDGTPIDADNCLWRWDSATLRWSKLRGTTQLDVRMAPRFGHWLFADDAQGVLVLHGGRAAAASEASVLDRVAAPEAQGISVSRDTQTETWLYDLEAGAWTTLPGVPGAPLAAAYVGGKEATLYTVGTGEGGSGVSGSVHFLRLLGSATERARPGALVWQTVDFPTNALTPGPRPRGGGALVPLSTGMGRNYLVYMFGCDDVDSDDAAARGHDKYYSDIWALQLPTHGFNAAAAKDAIRSRVPGMQSGELAWSAVELVATEQMGASEGKVHPGPRGLFGVDSCLSGKGVVLWGGVNPKGEKEADGWILRLAYGYADNDRRE
ncbi:hypothetical protein B0T24DRAFT_665838 [Lasiosphaeria ovina]|uniref:Kelch domain-containing protein n=1 Tax=Lasiosphaeria ovina TaxID=92902 RepID=A0AAE0KHS2_9PEZI|nr:hypothetical protein B0T24DRAFT_665838 [Lasiosphaeria ovina]